MAEENNEIELWKIVRAASNEVRRWPAWMRNAGKIDRMPRMKRFFLTNVVSKNLLTGKPAAMLYKFNKTAHDVIEEELVLGIFPIKKICLEIIVEVVKDPVVKLFKDVTDKEARECGFANLSHAALVTHLKMNDKIAIIKFGITEIGGTPVAKIAKTK